MIRQTSPVCEIRWLQAVNGSGEIVPPFAAVQVVDVDESGVIEIDQPNADSLTRDILFNGPLPMQVDGSGVITTDVPCYALYDTGDGIPANGEEWGVEAGSWKLRNNATGFFVVGGAIDERVMVLRVVNCCLQATGYDQFCDGGVPACGGRQLPATLYATISADGACTCLDGLEVELNVVEFLPGLFRWEGSASACSGTFYIRFNQSCGLIIGCLPTGNDEGIGLVGITSCEPWNLDYYDAFVASETNCCSGASNIYITITE